MQLHTTAPKENIHSAILKYKKFNEIAGAKQKF